MILQILITLSLSASANQSRLEKDFYEKAQPIFAKYCASCHSGESNLQNWLDFSTAASNRNVIYFRVFTLGDMPWRLRISSKEKNTLKEWLTMGVLND
jgi:hypothetical protein